MIKAVSAHYAEQHAKDKGGETWHECYGIWFGGDFRKAVEEKHRPQTWVYLNIKPEKLEPGEHDVDVWGKPGKLFFWRAQGYLRGVVVPAEEEQMLFAARQVMEEAPWRFDPIFALAPTTPKSP